MRLNQILAVEKEVKNRTYTKLTELHKISQKPELFAGFTKVYQPKAEDGETYPPESKKVQMRAEAFLQQVADLTVEYLDTEVRKDLTNCEAKTNVVLDGIFIFKNVPVTFLLTLEKNLGDLKTFVEKLPELSDDEEWKKGETDDLYYAEPALTHRTKKVQKSIVLYDATKEHPAQCSLVSEDEIVGYWKQVKISGAIAPKRKEALLDRLVRLSKAVKLAREEANMQEVVGGNVSQGLVDFLFAP